MKTAPLTLLFAAVHLLYGCRTPSPGARGEFQVTAGSRAASVIYSVVIDADAPQGGHAFGRLEPGGGADKTMGPLQLGLESDFRINWMEKSAWRSCILDLEGYEPVKGKIAGFYFTYRGGNAWTVVARSRTRGRDGAPRGRVVRPQTD